MSKWSFRYTNDVGPEDDGFWEWYEITDGKTIFKTDEQEDAEWLCNKLNEQEVK